MRFYFYSVSSYCHWLESANSKSLVDEQRGGEGMEGEETSVRFSVHLRSEHVRRPHRLGPLQMVQGHHHGQWRRVGVVEPDLRQSHGRLAI